jgi:hypothetical protein
MLVLRRIALSRSLSSAKSYRKPGRKLRKLFVGLAPPSRGEASIKRYLRYEICRSVGVLPRGCVTNA